MHHLTTYLIVGIVALIFLAAVGPTLSDLAHAAVPFIVAVGVVAIAVRLVFFHTRRW
jgi:hypothetical protein